MKTDEERARARRIVDRYYTSGHPEELPTWIAAALSSARREGRREGIEEAAQYVLARSMAAQVSAQPFVAKLAAELRALATPAQEERPKTEIPDWFWGSLR